MNFPDLPHLKQLQNDLWQWPRSRSALMVGAGFSLNAEPLPGVHSHFPTWLELASAMFDELYPMELDDSPEQAAERKVRLISANPLRIASEYEAAFDRRKLELLIRTKIPDSNHRPGNLHHLLLQLPWTDVFTTNYDTLLERTEIPGRNYYPVTTAAELTTAFAPRIVKLHGSFSSPTPFVSTEEDYRTYPRKFAPFVNSVQQSLLENSFVLIGFSGDDPNFLEWTGWIRDELGGDHAPIYLVGPLHLGGAKRLLLARRGVTTIDLAPVFESTPAPNGLHAASIEWFLKTLLVARKQRPEKWPNLKQHRSSLVNSHLPIVESGVVIPDVVRLEFTRHLNEEIVARLLKRWRFERREYPGWLVAPERNRTELWETTKGWLLLLTNFIKKWPAPDRILLLREINWRFETAMVPLFPESIEPVQQAFDEIFPVLAEGQTVRPSLDFLQAVSSSDSDVTDSWLELGFGLLREARETYNTLRWSELKAKIDRVVQHHQQHSDRNHYEAALWAMWNVERESAKGILSRWQPISRSPLAAIRKAGLLAELDELGEARTILRPALQEIRRAIRSKGQDIALLSLEGWCMYLLYAVESSSWDFTKRSNALEEFWERWEELKAWDCSPWSYKEHFEAVLNASPPKLQKSRHEVRGFDPGRVTVSLHLSGDPIAPYLPAFAYIRLYEQVGIPMRLPMVNIGGDVLKNACRWLAPFGDFWSPALLIRAGKLDDLSKSDFLSRTQVAAMDPALAKRLHIWCVQILERELTAVSDTLAMGSAQESLFEVLSEVLSRLAFKIDVPELRRTFPIVVRFHNHRAVRYHNRLHESSEPWFQRLFDAVDDEMLLEWLPDLIRVPLFDEGLQLVISAGRVWPDPMRHFPSERVGGAKKSCPELLAKIRNATDWLLRRAASESGEARQRAVTRLIMLHDARLMTSDQQRQLGELLWHERTTANLPDLPGFLAVAFLHLPTPPDIDVPSILKSYVLSLPSQGTVSQEADGRVSFAIGGSEQPLILQAALASKPIFQPRGEVSRGLDWTLEEARQLYKKASDWWMNDKVAVEYAKRGDLTSADSVKRTATRCGQFLARVVLPRMEWADEKEWQKLLQCLREMRELDIYPTLALPYVLLQRPSEAEAVAKTIGADIDSDVNDAVDAAAEAIRHWVSLYAIDRLPCPPPGFMRTLVERIIFRRKPGINSCLWHLAQLITERSEAITSSQAALLSASLLPWHHATILPTPDNGAGEFHEAERPNLRVGIANLAGALRRWYAKSSNEAPEPPGIALWQSLCKFDPLPEIRRALNSWDQVVSD